MLRKLCTLIEAAWRASFATSVVALLVIGSTATAESQCLRDTREVTLPDGSTKLRSYRCKTGDETDAAQFTLEFHRLSEAAAGSLLKGDKYPELDAIFGKPRIVKTPVGDEARLLFDQFGTRETTANCFAFKAEVPAELQRQSGDNNSGPSQDNCRQKRILNYLSFPDNGGVTKSDLPQPKSNQTLRTTSGWPAGYRFHYTPCHSRDELFGCTHLWRNLNATDIRDFDANMRAAQKQVGGNATNSIKKRKYLKLISHLTQVGWPEGFITVVGHYDVCGGFYDFSYYPRQLELEVALIQNASKVPLSFDGLLGASVNAGLRTDQLATKGQGSTIAIAKAVIAPGERILVPLRISFVNAENLTYLFDEPAEAAKTYKMIQDLPAGTIISETPSSGRVIFRKPRESFSPPDLPVMTTYVYGPEIALKGIIVNGKSVSPDDASRNFLALTAGDGGGSCPFLYAWNDKSSEWVRYGKVIHQATDKSKETTEERKLHGFTTRVRLAEEELELSYIDKVALKVESNDGSILMLKPAIKALQDKDDRYVKIYAGQKLDIDFEAPTWLNRGAITTTSVIITGYYERYSAIQTSSK